MLSKSETTWVYESTFTSSVLCGIKLEKIVSGLDMPRLSMKKEM